MDAQVHSPAPFQRPQSAPLQGTESAANALGRVKYTHDAMIDIMIANPGANQGELAKTFGYTQAWVSRVCNSDAFLARLAERKKDLVDPAIAFSLDEKFRSLADTALDVVMEKLTVTRNPDTALKALELASKAMGYGARQQNLNVQQNFVVAMPGKAPSSEAWASVYAPQSPALAALVQDATINASNG